MTLKKSINCFAIILAMCIMVFAAAAVTSHAADPYKNVKWTYSSGVLTLTGTKEGVSIPQVSTKEAWGQYKTKATKVVIGKNITSIDDFAFMGYKKLTKIDFGEVTALGQECFAECTALKSVTIPDNLTYIGGENFRDCSALESVSFGVATFNTSYHMIANNSCFTRCTSLKTIKVESGNPYIEVKDNVLFYGKNIWTYPSGKKSTSYTIPDGTTGIFNGAFDNNKYLEKISIPSSVTTIAPMAFRAISKLEYLTIPSSVTSLGIDGDGEITPIVQDSCALKAIYNKSAQTLVTENTSSGDYDYFWKNANTGKYANTFEGETTVKQVKFRIYLSGKTFTKDGVKYQVVSGYNYLSPKDLNNKKTISSVKVVSNPYNKVTGSTVEKGYYYSIKTVGRVYAVNGIKYRITSTGSNKKVAVVGCTSQSVKSVTIGSSVKINGTKYNIRSIGKNAFKGYSKLKTITIKNSYITSVGSYAVKGIYSKAKIKVPKSKVSKYMKLFTSSTGFKSTMKVTYY